jgi:hypothetical protein
MTQEYSIEFDVALWDYVLKYQGKTIPLTCANIRDAEWRARMIIEGRKLRNE